MCPEVRYRIPLGGLAHRNAIPTVARLIRSRIGARPPTRPVGSAELKRRVDAALAHIGRSADVGVAQVSQIDGWVDTDVSLRRGEQVTIVATGTLWAVRSLGIGIGPEVGLWVRVGDGAVTSMLGNAMVIHVDTDGPMRLLAAEPGVLDDNGDVDHDVRRTRLRGCFALAVIAWHTDPTAALAAAASADPDLFGACAERAASGSPPGWHYHPRLGAADIFRHHPQAPPAEIDCHTHGDVGILCLSTDVAITEDLRMSWSWLVTSLPSALPENIEPTHDYLSVAVEFDDGRDLSWMWSAQLAEGTVFRCPLAYWRDRETHLVIRTGNDRLGQWITERRSLADDIHYALTPPYPRRVTAIWLIANSTFQRGTGTCRYRDLTLTTAGDPRPNKEQH
ncbi:MAG: DUF3047 domain-containing protein [Mycobacteriaceae bacterium]